MTRLALTGSFLLITIILTVDCMAQVPVKRRCAFTVSEATQETWSPGIVADPASSSGGMLYRITVRTRKKGISFHQLVTSDARVDIEVVRGAERNATGPFAKGEELVLVARSAKDSPAPDAALRIKAGNAAALILFSRKGKRFYCPVGHLDKRAKTLNQ